MHKITEIEFNILKIIYLSKGTIYLFTLYRKAKIDFKRLFILVNKLLSIELIQQEEFNESVIIKLTNKGLSLIQDLIIKKQSKSWRNVPDEMIVIDNNVKKFYIPNIKKLDYLFFQINNYDNINTEPILG